ncbi:nucleotide pyrophosphohydrolase [Gammaproteobacteria bacterium]|nr:nucleotide pyrophosphohydrolase [Gammaproteobacteria bacterium]
MSLARVLGTTCKLQASDWHQSLELTQAEREKVELELADALIYLVRLADKLDVGLITAANKKMAINEGKYPVEQVRGSAKKYTEYD